MELEQQIEDINNIRELNILLLQVRNISLESIQRLYNRSYKTLLITRDKNEINNDEIKIAEKATKRLELFLELRKTYL